MTQNNDNDGKGSGNELRQSQYPNQDELDELDRKLAHDIAAVRDAEREGYVVLDGPETAIPHFSSICTYCVHWNPRKGRTCAAYTAEDSIPLAIWLGRITHVFPYKGDHGVQFTIAPDVKKLPDIIQADLAKRAEQHASGNATASDEQATSERPPPFRGV